MSAQFRSALVRPVSLTVSTRGRDPFAGTGMVPVVLPRPATGLDLNLALAALL